MCFRGPWAAIILKRNLIYWALVLPDSWPGGILAFKPGNGRPPLPSGNFHLRAVSGRAITTRRREIRRRGRLCPVVLCLSLVVCLLVMNSCLFHRLCRPSFFPLGRDPLRAAAWMGLAVKGGGEKTKDGAPSPAEPHHRGLPSWFAPCRQGRCCVPGNGFKKTMVADHHHRQSFFIEHFHRRMGVGGLSVNLDLEDFDQRPGEKGSPWRRKLPAAFSRNFCGGIFFCSFFC